MSSQSEMLALNVRAALGQYNDDSETVTALVARVAALAAMADRLRFLEKSLNTRATVEQELWDVYHGKRPLPDGEQCAEWARKLGIPEQFRRPSDTCGVTHGKSLPIGTLKDCVDSFAADLPAEVKARLEK